MIRTDAIIDFVVHNSTKSIDMSFLYLPETTFVFEECFHVFNIHLKLEKRVSTNFAQIIQSYAGDGFDFFQWECEHCKVMIFANLEACQCMHCRKVYCSNCCSKCTQCDKRLHWCRFSKTQMKRRNHKKRRCEQCIRLSNR